MIETASFEGKLYAAPFNTNTQLLWYRKDLVKKAPRTWDEMIDEAEKLGRDNAGTIQVQANRYEGFTVWANALIESAGTQLLSGPESGRPRRGADDAGARGDGPLRQLLGGAAQPLDLRRGHRPDRLRGGRIGLHDQLHLRLRQRQGRSAGDRQEHGLRPLPADRRQPAQQAAARRLQPRGQLLLGEQGRRLRRRRLPGQRQEPADRDRTRRPAALALGPLLEQSRDRGLPGLRRAGQAVDRRRRAAAQHRRLPGRQPGGAALAAPARQDRPRRRRPRSTTNCARTSKTRSSGKGCSDGGDAQRQPRPASGPAPSTASPGCSAPRRCSRCSPSPPTRSATRSSSRSSRSTCASPTRAASSASTTTPRCSAPSSGGPTSSTPSSSPWSPSRSSWCWGWRSPWSCTGRSSAAASSAPRS